MDRLAAVDWDEYLSSAERDYARAATVEQLSDVNVAYQGRRSPLKLALRDVRDRETGIRLNDVRRRIEELEQAAAERVSRSQLAARLEERVDVTLPSQLLGDVKLRRRGTLHPSTQVRRHHDPVDRRVQQEHAEDEGHARPHKHQHGALGQGHQREQTDHITVAESHLAST